jgi:hypothetical protein
MSTNLIPIKAFLGKYYPELLYSAAQEKYKDTGLDSLFDQRFLIQNNKTQMIVDPAMTGLIISVNGNEISVSQELFDHPGVIITNSLENGNPTTNPRSLYNAETFSTIAYLICQNHTTFQIVGELDEPIYVKYKSDFETFYNSVVVFNINNDLDIEIVEEFESAGALNVVTNYILNPSASVNLTTFYQNNISALSYCYRNIMALENSTFNHMLFGKGSSNIIDENRLRTSSGSNAEFLGIVNSNGRNFHSILYVEPSAQDYSVSVDYRDVKSGKSNVTFLPVIIGQAPEGNSATISVTEISLEEIPEDEIEIEVKKFLNDIIERATLVRMTGVERFYNNKTKFLHFP